MSTTKKKGWSYVAGERGRNRVRAYEEPKTGALFLEFYERAFGASESQRKRVAVRSPDRQVAKRKADELAAALAAAEPPRSDVLTLRVLFDNYLRETAGQKGESKRAHDERTAEMLVRFFGAESRAKDLNKRHWNRFIEARRRGDIAPKGVTTKRVVGDRVVEYDLRFLMAVLNWATVSGADGHEGVLLDRNPLVGLPMPKNANPKRPMITQEQYQQLLDVSGELPELFRLALILTHETGHRIVSVRSLRWSDIDLGSKKVRWREENDKIGFEHVTPLTEPAITALKDAQARRPAIGDAWVFPSPDDPARPCSRHLVRDWWERAAAKAKLPTGERLGWHSLRRKFATDLADTDPKTLTSLGGWKCFQTVITCYQRPDEMRQREALENRQKRRAGASG